MDHRHFSCCHQSDREACAYAQKRGIKYVPISRAYTIDIDRISGSPAGRQPTKPEACSATTAAAVWQNVETSSKHPALLHCGLANC